MLVSAEWVENDRDYAIARESPTKECITIELFVKEKFSRSMLKFHFEIIFNYAEEIYLLFRGFLNSSIDDDA